MRAKRIPLPAALLLLLCASVMAQTTRPAPEGREGFPPDLKRRIEQLIRSQNLDTVHLLVQLTSSPERVDRDRLEREGVRLLEPLDRRTWHASVNVTAADTLPRVRGVRWADIHRPEDKLSRLITPEPQPWQKRPNGRAAYTVLFHKDVRPEQVSAMAQRLGFGLEDFVPRAFPVTRTAKVILPPSALRALGEQDIVQWIEPEPAPDIPDNRLNVQPLSNVDDVQAAPFGLTGSGINVGVWEAQAVTDGTHLDLTPRVKIEAGQTATNNDHATHVAGTIASSGANVANAEGMAPQANLSAWDSSGDANEMTLAATSAGGALDPLPVRISNHSYSIGIGWNGSGTSFNANQNQFGLYTIASANYDNVVRNAGLMVFKSAGNDRNDAPPAPVAGQPADCTQGGLGIFADCIEPRGNAKNVFTIGAMNGAANITAFSSFGPTDDGRIKPDLMAHGQNVLSLACNCFADEDGNGTDDVVPNTTTASTSKNGTSQATPAAAGMAALILQDAARRNLPMTPAMMKALMIQTARDVAGTGQATAGPDYATGWGIVDAQAAVNLLRQGGIQEGTLNATGIPSAWTAELFVPPGLGELKVTLAWTDPAGTPGGQILINNLDLRLIAPDATVVTPWILNPATPGVAAVRNGGNDSVNNVEQVSVLTPMPGTWTVRVSADAGNLPQAPQTFAVAGILPRSDVVLVMDRSGSMTLPSGTPGVTKIQALRTSAHEFIDLLDLAGGHAAGLVQFSSSVTPLVPTFDLQALTPGNVGNAHTAIDSITASGLTNIISGVDTAITQLSGALSPAPRQAIVVFSDGMHNTPPGSDLNTIGPPIQAGNYRFYSIGFGTDVDDSILSNIANASGGIHVNEQDLSPIQLTKHFLTVGALVHDLTVIADPSFDVGNGQAARLTTTLTPLDRSVIFAVNWTGTQAQQVSVRLTGPKKCDIPATSHAGYDVRTGRTYTLVKLDLPYRCGVSTLHAGKWTIEATPSIRGTGKETVDIMILGDTRLKIDADVKYDAGRKQYVLTTQLTGSDDAYDAVAHVLTPLARTKDSADQDRGNGDKRPPKSTARGRTKEVKLAKSTGKRNELVTMLDPASLKPGLNQVRVVAYVKVGRELVRREATATFYVK